MPNVAQSSRKHRLPSHSLGPESAPEIWMIDASCPILSSVGEAEARNPPLLLAPTSSITFAFDLHRFQTSTGFCLGRARFGHHLLRICRCKLDPPL